MSVSALRGICVSKENTESILKYILNTEILKNTESIRQILMANLLYRSYHALSLFHRRLCTSVKASFFSLTLEVAP